ncbi:TetR/AcrR family transcriptional regulator [Phenylobacterium sp. LjRoot219]|uniref:TetR/AcrR family transcriptional regulator n=1 Tax=Phenylobacterium sp. LjRoot219 TaxID=3342283 RepID=UPI003ECECA8B
MIGAGTRKRVRAKPEHRREQILDEAVRLIGELGYYGFTIQALAQRCQLSNPGLLHYFGSKEQLLVALLQDRDRRDAEAVTTIAGVIRQGDQEPTPTLRQVLDLFRATVVRNASQPELVRLYAVLQAEALNSSHPAHGYFTARKARTIAAFSQMVAPYVGEPRSTALQLTAMMGGLEQEWLRADQGFDIVAEWDRVAAKLLPIP